MTTRDEAIAIAVDGQRIAGTVVTPDTLLPGVLFVHGWGGSQENYLARARQIAALGCVCLTFNLRGRLAAYRWLAISPDENRALGACAAFRGDVLIVESEHDDIIPHPVIANYMAAFEKAHSLTYRVIEGSDHGLSEEPWQQAFTTLLVTWATEMVLGAREGAAALGTSAPPSQKARTVARAS